MSNHLKFLTDYSKKKLTFLTLDTLNDSSRVIKFIGVVFVLIGVLIFSNKLIITDLILTTIALSGIFFIAADFNEYFVLKTGSRKNIADDIKQRKIKKYRLCKIISLFFAILTLIIGPYLNLKPNSAFLNKLSNSLSLIAIGLTILKVGMDNSKEILEYHLQIMNEVKEIIEFEKSSEATPHNKEEFEKDEGVLGDRL